MKEENVKSEYQRKVDKSLIPTCNIMGVNIAAINMNWLLKYIDENLSDIKGDYICVSNVHVNASESKKKKIKKIYEKCSVLIALSEEWKERLSQIVSPSKISVIENYSILHAIAEYVISCGGVVFGCEFSDDRVCRHTMATDISDLGKFQGSKYVQSELGDCFKSIKEQLDADKKVLFIGMPCQVAGLESYIKRNKENLYLMDLACHGVPSPGVFKDFIQFLEHKYKGKISNFVFRDKTYGYSATNIKVYFANGKTIDCRNDIKTFTRLMFKGITLRPSCYECAFKTKHRVSDITIFDCALVGSYNKDMDDDIGTTSILCHSDKGKKLLEQPDVIDKMRIKSVDSEELILTEGSMLIASAKKSENREAFFHDRELMTYEQLTNKYAPITLKMIIGDIVKRSLRYTGPIGKAVILYNKKKSIHILQVYL